jgi:hypothetical protein
MKHKMGGVLEFVLWNVYLSPHSLSIIEIEFLYSLKFQQKKKIILIKNFIFIFYFWFGIWGCFIFKILNYFVILIQKYFLKIK